MNAIRRGRKRSAKPRYPGGRVKHERVEPTPEQQSRRGFLVGDPAKTGYPLGILLVNDGISERQHEAGCRYAWLYQSVLGKVSIAGTNYEGVYRGRGYRVPDVDLERLREMELSEAADKLMDVQAKDITDALCVFGRIPRWMRPVPPTHQDVNEAKLFLAGLTVLTEVMGT